LVAAACAASVPTFATNCQAPSSTPTVKVDLPGHPFQAVSSRDGCWIFAGIIGDGEKPVSGIAVIRRGGGKLELVQTAKLQHGVTGIVLTHDGKLLIAAVGAGVLLLDVERLKSGVGDPIIARVDEEQTSGSVYVNVTRDDRILFVSEERARAITVIDLKRARSGAGAKSITGKIPTGNAPIALTLSPDEKWMYTTSQSAPPDWNWPAVCDSENPQRNPAKHTEGAVIVVDVVKARTDPANAVAARVAAGCNPVRLAISPKGDRAYVTNRKDDAVRAWDTTRLRTDPVNALIGKVPVGTAPVPVVVIQNGTRVIAGNSNRFGTAGAGNQSLAVIDAARFPEGARAVIGTIPAGLFPRSLAVTSDGRTLLLANFGSGSIETMDIARLSIEKSQNP
jgi:DNA-binding beta-propeller fold protein YncE